MRGVIAAGDAGTAAAGQQILQAGGNAVDAAVAAAFASFIAEIGVVHLGGSGIAHLYDPQSGRSLVYDFFSNTPGLEGTSPNPLDFHEVTIDFGATTQNFHLGRASVAVPGNIAGLCQMAADYGRLPLETLLQPALKLAKDGLSIAPFQAETCALLQPLYTYTAGMRAIFSANGRMIRANERLYVPNLYDTLQTLAREGAAFAQTGALAQALAADQAQNGGLLTLTDLANYRVQKLPSIRLPYREYEILLPPPSSTGGVLTAFTLKLLTHFDMQKRPHGSASHLQLLYEVMVATNRARNLWEDASDALPVEEAIGRFLDDRFVKGYVEEVQDALISKSASPFAPEPPAPNNTSHLSVVDGDGLAVSLTTTAGESAGYVVPSTGYIPNNMMGEADLHPNGFHTRPVGQRLPTMMTPVVVLKDGQTRLVLGSGGSIRIRSAIMQVLSNLLDYRMSLDDAVNTARVHVEDGALQCELGYQPEAVDELEGMGYPVNRWPVRSIYFGGAHSVSRKTNGRLVAAGDSRRGGATAVA
ncbi:gamma-glutamyltransferase [Candidatus Leptofilum sp.]|uniref:gamma-glutamyltransferase n=1 Tax=Candidatus Leptofilum sp. TaxID=3241576 RepID=UPI003B5AC9C6